MPRPFLRNIAALALMLAVAGVVISCGGRKANIPSLPIPNIAGPWQFITVSTGR
jgi:hypothetical protein